MAEEANAGLFGVLLMTGLLGGVGHCVGMCGPLAIMAAVRAGSAHLPVAAAQLAYHTARVAIYVTLGAAAGALGSLFGFAHSLNAVAGALSMALGVAVILLALSYFGLLRFGLPSGADVWLDGAMSRAVRLDGTGGVVLLGALNGLLPCGLAYGALLVAATLGGPLASAAGMAVFGLATVPPLLFVGVGAGLLGVRARQRLSRVAGILMMGAGLQLSLRGMSALGLTPHLLIGGLMLW